MRKRTSDFIMPTFRHELRWVWKKENIARLTRKLCTIWHQQEKLFRKHFAIFRLELGCNCDRFHWSGIIYAAAFDEATSFVFFPTSRGCQVSLHETARRWFIGMGRMFEYRHKLLNSNIDHNYMVAGQVVDVQMSWHRGTQAWGKRVRLAVGSSNDAFAVIELQKTLAFDIITQN